MTMAVARVRDREVVPGAWVKAARAVTGKSQTKLAGLIGRDKSTIAKYEAIGGEVDRVVWYGILYALHLPIDWEPGRPVVVDVADDEPKKPH